MTARDLLHVLSYPGQVLVHPGVHPGEVRPGTVHPEAGHPDHCPGVAEGRGEQGAPAVSVAGVPGAVTCTHLVLPDGHPADGGVGGGAGVLSHHGDSRLPQSVLGPAPRAGGAPADDVGPIVGQEGAQLPVMVVVWQAGWSTRGVSLLGHYRAQLT